MTLKPKPNAGAVFATPGPERDAAVAGIIRATGLPLQQPVDEDYLAALIFLTVCDLVEMADARNLDSAVNRNRLTQFRKGIEHCMKQTHHPWVKEMADSHRLADLLKRLRVWDELYGRRAARRSKGQPSALDRLIGLWLPLIYERCFGLRASPGSWGSEPHQPVIRFIRAVLEELELNCGDNTIRSAMRDFKRLRGTYAEHGVYTPAHWEKKFTRPVAR